jgi:hypothetical protein
MAFSAGELKRFKQVSFTANQTTAVSVTLSGIDDNSMIIPILKTKGGTGITLPYVHSKNTSTGVVEFKSFSNDTSVYNVYVIN